MVLNTGPLDWESSALTTRPLFKGAKGTKGKVPNIAFYQVLKFVQFVRLLYRFNRYYPYIAGRFRKQTPMSSTTSSLHNFYFL